MSDENNDEEAGMEPNKPDNITDTFAQMQLNDKVNIYIVCNNLKTHLTLYVTGCGN